MGKDATFSSRDAVMTLIEFYSKLKKLEPPFFKTQDVAIICDISNAHASQLLTRLAKLQQIISLKKGLWVMPDKIESLALPCILTMPAPSYISLQTALYYHGMIMQIPETIYAVSIARTKVYKLAIATLSIHHITPDMFFGYEEIAPYTLMATAEKALIDFLYFSQAKSRLFSNLPELEVPDTFDIDLARSYLSKVPDKNRHQRVSHLFNQLITTSN